jgi:hydroxymethylbilane synthase
MIRVATRGSALARWQADHVVARLRRSHPDLEVALVVIETFGDRRQDVPIVEMGGQGVFVKEVQAAVLAGRADIAVHSAKDLPALTAPGLQLAAFPGRDDPRDVLVGAALAELAPGATVATGSVRRRAQLASLRPDLRWHDLRGNIATRLSRVPSGGAVVVAAAALNRLGLAERAAEVLDVDVMVPQVAQGALAVECRAGDEAVAALLAPIDEPDIRVAVEAERAFLARLGSGCDLPVGAYAERRGGLIDIVGLIADVDGSVVVRDRRTGPIAGATALAVALADHLLSDLGGEELLAAGNPAGATRSGKDPR